MIVMGKDVVVLITDGATRKTYACGRSCTLSLTTEFIETTVTGQGSFATFLPTKHSFTASIDGIMNLQKPGLLSLSDLREKQIAKTILEVRFSRTDLAGNKYTDAFFGYIESSEDAGTYNDLATFNITLRGTGVLTQEFF